MVAVPKNLRLKYWKWRGGDPYQHNQDRKVLRQVWMIDLPPRGLYEPKQLPDHRTLYQTMPTFNALAEERASRPKTLVEV
jgi:hypothetical protein